MLPPANPGGSLADRKIADGFCELAQGRLRFSVQVKTAVGFIGSNTGSEALYFGTGRVLLHAKARSGCDRDGPPADIMFNQLVVPRRVRALCRRTYYADDKPLDVRIDHEREYQPQSEFENR